MLDYLTVAQASKRINVSERAIYRAIHAGRCKANNSAGVWLIHTNDLAEFVRTYANKDGVTITDIAEKYGISRTGVWKAIGSSKLEPIGGHVANYGKVASVYAEQDIEALARTRGWQATT